MRSLASAKLLRADGDSAGACNRAYYAMFDAAHAALAICVEDFNPGKTRTHSGLISAVGQDLVLSGRLPIELGKALGRVEQLRKVADYTGEDITMDQAGEAIRQAEAFLDAVRRLVQP